MTNFKFSLAYCSILLAFILIWTSCKKDDPEENDPPEQNIEWTLPSDTTVSAGTTLILDAGNPGADYLWSTGQSSQTIEVTASGSYSVTVTFGDVSESATVEVVFEEEEPVIIPISVDLGGDQTLFLGNSVSLDAGPFSEEVTYTWSTGETTQSITVSEAGAYTVEVNNGTSTDTDTVNVTLALQITLSGDTTLVDGSEIILDAGNPGAAYSWSNGETSQTIAVDTSGVYFVSVNYQDLSSTAVITVNMVHRTIQMETDFGTIYLWLYNQTPIHKENFISLSNQSFFDGVTFHRVVDEFVIQGGDPTGTGSGDAGYTLEAEIVESLPHVYGALGAAREGDDINPDFRSSSSQFYIVDDNNGTSFLNGSYTVFGIVMEGMDVVEAISEVPTDSNDKPIDDVKMTSVTVENYSYEELINQFGFTIP